MLDLVFYGLVIVLTAISIIFVRQLQFALGHFRVRQFISSASTIKDLPSVSVCIPARNEKHAMTQCLEKVLASTYPKLEIIVLDDSSKDDTSVLIKSFAHAGVRFVEGTRLPHGWLGKNHALDGLLKEASGSLIFYMDVDTLVEPDTIGQLVAYAKLEQAAMVSVLPFRADGWRWSVLFSTLRYFRELIMHRRKSPAVSGNAWLIDRHILENELQGFKECKQYIQPEAYFARRLAVNDKYRFLISTPMLGVNYEKKWRSQIETGMRLSFPIFGGRIVTNLLALLAVAIISLPLVITLNGLFTEWSYIHAFAFWQLSVFAAIYGLFLSGVWGRGWWIGMLLWPVILVQEWIVMFASLIRYATGTVTWKGRPVATTKNQLSTN